MGLFTNKKKLFRFIENNRVMDLKKALTSPKLLQIKNKDGNTLLIHSIIHHTSEITALLLEAGADPNICNEILPNNYNSYPLHFAASHNQHEIVKLLLDHGGDPNARDIKALTPLHRACKFGAYESARELVTRGGEVNAITVFNTQPIHYAAERGCTELVQLLLEHGASLNGLEADIHPPLYWAVKGLHLETAGMLYARGAESGSLHLTELQKAFLKGVPIHPKDHDLNATDIFGRTILFYAAASGNTGFAASLVKEGCDPDIVDTYEMKAGDYKGKERAQENN